MKKILLALLLLISACGGGSGDDGSNEEIVIDDPQVTTTIHAFGLDNNLWKPSADSEGSTPGNVVILINPAFTERFDSCEVPLHGGEVRQVTCVDYVEWTHIPYSCFGNGGRQTWRTDFKCHEVLEVKVTCYLRDQIHIFTVPDEVRYNVCSRFG